MATVREHYAQLLAEHYTWSKGDFSQQITEGAALLQGLGICTTTQKERAVDLGSGAGPHSLALARAGYRVTAIDQSRTLLDQLRDYAAGGESIERVEGDLLNLANYVSAPVDVVVCMGDTLTHLSSQGEVEMLFATVHKALKPGGRFVVNYRDLSFELTGVERFIPVCSEADRVFTCFLEYEPERVMVHDLVHVRTSKGWQLQKSAYPKLRLPVAWVQAALVGLGMEVDSCETTRGLVTLAATRP